MVLKKVKVMRGFVIAKNVGMKDLSESNFYVFAKEEWSYGEGYRTAEFECESLNECVDNIRSYRGELIW